MKCLSQKQLAQLALGVNEDAVAAAHLETCPACRANLEEMQALRHQLTEVHVRLEQGHAEARARLLASLPAASQLPDPMSVWDRINHWTGGLTMRQRMALGGMGVAALLALVLIWGAIVAEPGTAMAQMAQKVREAQSYEYTMILKMKMLNQENGKPPVTEVMHGKVYWLAPGSYRIEAKSQSRPGVGDTQICPAGKPGLHLDDKQKTYYREPARQGHISPLMLVERLGEFSGQADRDLGTKDIGGKKAHGFQIAAKKIDPDAFEEGMAEIWIDQDSKLPALVRLDMKMAQMPGELRMEDFHWNIPLDAKLFDTQPPAGYTDATSKPQPLEKKVLEITKSLKFYAELMEGHYPRGKMVYGDVTRDELLEKVGIKGPLTREKILDNRYSKVTAGAGGFAFINAILPRKPRRRLLRQDRGAQG